MADLEVITREALVSWSKGQIAADDVATLTVAAVNDYVTRLPVADRVVTDPETGAVTVPEGVKLGALILAAKVHRRRMSPNGIEAVNGDSVAFVARYDPEVSRFLELDRPVVG